MKKNTFIKKRHYFYFFILRPVAGIINKIVHFKGEKKRLKKNENYLILSNHQTGLDSVFVASSFNKPVYMVGSYHVFNLGWISKIIVHCLSPISKAKAVVDVQCIKNCMKVAKEKGNICIFPEGNRTWTDNLWMIDKAIVKFIRKLNLPILLYHIEGGFGVNPRFGNKFRKGKIEGKIKKIISLEEISKISDDELYLEILNNLKQNDYLLNQTYKSKQSAEYLERCFFVCPTCGKMNTLKSLGNTISCNNCSFTATYDNNLKLSTNDKLDFRTLTSWYNYQIDYVKNYEPLDKIVLEAKDAKIYEFKNGKRILISKGNLLLNKDGMYLDTIHIPFEDIIGSSVIGAVKFTIITATASYFIVGPTRFNAISYLLFLNRFVPSYIRKGGDEYYGLHQFKEFNNA